MDAETGSFDDNVLKFHLGYYPMQCDDCGRGLVNMGCRICSPFMTPVRKNRGGFSQFGQLTVMPQSCPASPRKRASSRLPPQPILKVEYTGVDGESPGLILGNVGLAEPRIKKGKGKPFLRRTTPGSEFNVHTIFRWRGHKKEYDIPCVRGISDVELFRSFCIYFRQFIEGMKKERCADAGECLCGGTSSSKKPQDVRIYGYHLFNIDESYTIELISGPSRKI